MTRRALTVGSFPNFRTPIVAEWAPIVLEPIEGSVERLVTQIANVSEVLNSLEEQADQEELRLVRLPSAKAISARVLELET